MFSLLLSPFLQQTSRSNQQRNSSLPIIADEYVKYCNPALYGHAVSSIVQVTMVIRVINQRKNKNRVTMVNNKATPLSPSIKSQEQNTQQTYYKKKIK